MHKVLVLDANQRSALAIIRSLGRKGLEVIAGDHLASPLGSASRYARTSLRYPNPATAPITFVAEILSAASELGIDTIIPASDLTTMLVVSQPDLARIACVAAPPASSYEHLTDKARLVQLAWELGIPVPITHIAHSASEITRAAEDIGFPIVLKPARSRYLKGDRIVSTGVQLAEDPALLSRVLNQESWLQDIPCLVQRFVPGHGGGIFTLYGNSGPVAWFAHRRIREKPPSGGVSVLSESVPIDPIMQSAAAKLLSAVGWSGVAMVEFRIGEDGTAYLMEVNGRFWGSLQLAVDCGIDFPWLLYQVTRGASVASPAPYALGRRLRWLLGDLDSLLIRLKQTRAIPGARTRAYAEFLRSFGDPRCHQETLRLGDPGPGFREAAQWIKALSHSRDQ